MKSVLRDRLGRRPSRRRPGRRRRAAGGQAAHQRRLRRGLRRSCSSCSPRPATAPSDPIPVAIETPRGLLVAALRATGRPVYAINPMAVARYRERHTVSRKKSDHADAMTLANILRTDAHAAPAAARRHRTGPGHRRARPRPPGRDLAAHQGHPGTAVPAARVLPRLPGRVRQRQRDQPRQRRSPRGPGASRPRRPQRQADHDPDRRGAAPRPAASAASTRWPRELPDALREPQLRQLPLVEEAMGTPDPRAARRARTPRAPASTTRRGRRRGVPRSTRTTTIITSFPGLADLTGARVLAEIGDDRSRFADARALKAYAGSAPVTRASGRSISITRRRIKNDRLAAAGFLWAFAAITTRRRRREHYRPPPRPRRPPRRRAAAPVQPHARPAPPLPANRPDLRPGQGLRPRLDTPTRPPLDS